MFRASPLPRAEHSGHPATGVRAGSARVRPGLLFLVALLGLATNADARTAAQTYEVRAQCSARPRCFAKISEALEAVERDASDGWVTIDVGPGAYREKVTVARPRTRLRGAGAGRARLFFDAVAQSARHYHRDGWGTPGSATLTINAEDVVVSGMTVENGFDYLANDALAQDDPRRIGNPQAVALLLDVESDRVLIERVSIVGYQDTLFANGKRALVRDSFISGNIDFIFGNGALMIEDSELRSRRRAALPAKGELQSYIAAPSTPRSQPFGIVVLRSRLTREAGVPDGAVALARPWHPTTTFADGRYADPNAVGQALFIDCRMDAHISPEHWTSMGGTARDGSKTAIFRPQDARFHESGSRGPGARRVDIGMTWVPPLDIGAMRAAFFEGWSLPKP